MHPQLWFSGRPDSSQQCSVNIYDRFVDSYPCEYWCWHPEAIINKGLYVKRIPVSWQFQPECHPNVEMSNRVASSSVYWTHWRYREWTAIYRCFTHLDTIVSLVFSLHDSFCIYDNGRASTRHEVSNWALISSLRVLWIRLTRTSANSGMILSSGC